MPEIISSSKLNTEIICPDAISIYLNNSYVIIINNKTGLCPSTSTCCLASDGQWGCCPVENAVGLIHR